MADKDQPRTTRPQNTAKNIHANRADQQKKGSFPEPEDAAQADQIMGRGRQGQQNPDHDDN